MSLFKHFGSNFSVQKKRQTNFNYALKSRNSHNSRNSLINLALQVIFIRSEQANPFFNSRLAAMIRSCPSV